ncbi:MAG: tRNA adenosine(34) deaminase TadA [Clostridia bacterium]|nr:tRNA adenosine(34) deaminase TadA [Clostridia bacterium]
MDHRYYMKIALEEGLKAFAQGEVPIGAVLVHQGQVISRAFNLRETEKDPTAHAEMLVIKQGSDVLGGWRLLDTTLYVTLEPCPMCAGAIVQARIPRVVYGAADPKAGAVDSLYRLLNDSRLNHQAEVIAGVMEDECKALMKDFFKKLRDQR